MQRARIRFNYWRHRSPFAAHGLLFGRQSAEPCYGIKQLPSIKIFEIVDHPACTVSQCKIITTECIAVLNI
jgi:hypothetical protein